MDLTSSSKEKLVYFRIKELKDVLSQLGLAKQGKKQDLVDRILSLLLDDQASKSHGSGKKDLVGKEAVAKIIDDTYRKMQVPGATDLVSKSHSGSYLNHVKPKEELIDSYHLDMKVRCLCGSSLITESMIKCEDPRCQAWQHIGCVIVPEKPMEGVPPELPSHFYCEICRVNRADPFWVTIAHPLLPLKLISSGTIADGAAQECQLGFIGKQLSPIYYVKNNTICFFVQDLVDRILSLLLDDQASKSHGSGKKDLVGKEAVAKIIDDTYRKMQVPGATDLVSKSHSGSYLNHVKPKEELIDSYHLDMKVRCLCGSSLITESMIKCEDPRCQAWQHIGCVIVPEKPMEGVPPELPSHFYCEICRVNRADPFWVTIAHPLLPLKLISSGTIADGTTTVQNVDRTFQLSRADREMLQRTEYDLQVWCLLLNDKVLFRMQWPLHTDLQVNGIAARAINRPATQPLGINGRDDGPVITAFSREGINRICLTRCDARVFCFGIRIGRRRTLEQVLSLVPKEACGESFDDALARVRRCVGGGNGTENAESDSDLEVVADFITVNLRCPMSGSRIRTAGRFKPCAHMGCFDLEAFVELSQRSRKWQCPICLKNYSLEDIIVDPYFNRVTTLMRHCGEDVAGIDVKPDGSWRAKNENEFRDLAQWHLPDGSVYAATDADVKPDLDMLKQIKNEGISGHTGLRLGIRRNRNGIWEVSKPEDIHPPSEKYENNCQNIMPMSSSATGSYRDGEDPSVNQEGHFDFAMNNSHELDSLPLNFEPTYNVVDPMPPVPLQDADVIVLSDSEDDNVTMISPGTVYDSGPAGGTGIPFSNHPGISERFMDDPGFATSGTSCLGLFNTTGDDFGIPLWPMQSSPQTGSGFQLFDTNHDDPDVLADAHGSLPGVPIGGYNLTSEDGLGVSSQIHDPFTYPSNGEINGGLVDNPLAFGSDDPSLQIFLPSRSTGVPPHNDVGKSDVPNGNHPEVPSGDHSDDWISLTLTAGRGHDVPPPKNEINSRQQLTSKGCRMESVADTASLLLSMNDRKTKKGSSDSKRSDGPFSHPRQPRSVRPRLYLSIDTDSD